MRWLETVHEAVTLCKGGVLVRVNLWGAHGALGKGVDGQRTTRAVGAMERDKSLKSSGAKAVSLDVRPEGRKLERHWNHYTSEQNFPSA